jgi:acyl carrier protein phosphodiesterase
LSGKVIETTVPEIDIAELMERVRAEALRPKPSPPPRFVPPAESAAGLPPVALLPGAPAVWVPAPIKSKKERLDALVETAREKNEPNSWIPKFLRRFFRKQGAYNRAVVESIAALSKTADDLTRRVGEISTCLGQLNGWLLALHEQSDSDATWMKAAAPTVSKAASQENELRHFHAELESIRTTLNRISADSSKGEALEQKVAALADRISAAETQFRSQSTALTEQADAAGELRTRVDGIG